MRNKIVTLCTVALSVALMTGCATHKFIPTGLSENNRPPQKANCNATILLDFPKEKKYQEIGLCMAQTPGGGMISDKTPEAIEELQRCACIHGGNAVVLSNTSDAGFTGTFGGYSQQVAKAKGVAIFVEK